MRATITRTAPYLAPVALLLTLAVLVRAHGQLPYPDARLAYGDQYRYIAMAQGSSSPLAREAPFCWRVLTPWIVHALPLPTLVGFWLTTLAGLIGATLALQWLLRGLALPRGATIAGGFAFVLLGPATGFALWAYTYADALPLCLVTLALACAVHRRVRLLLLVAAIGALAKETMILSALFALVYAWWQRDWHLLRWALAACAAVASILLLLRWLIPSPTPFNFIGEFALIYVPPALSTETLLLALTIAVGRLLSATIGTWTALFPLAALQALHPPRFWQTNPAFGLFLLGATAQILVAQDIERLAAYAAPALIAAVCFEVERLAAHWRLSRWALWVPLLLVQLYWWLPYAGWPTPMRAWVTLGTLDQPHRLLAGAIFAATLLQFVPRLLRRRSAQVQQA